MFSETARTIARERYAQPGEEIEDIFKRVAGALAETQRANYTRQVGIISVSDAIESEAKIFEQLMLQKKLIPAGRTLANAGVKEGRVVANCVVLPIEDSMDSIGETLRNAMLLQQQGCGIGFNFSNLRPAGFETKKSQGVASGPVSFMKIYDSVFGTIKQQGRHGANMGMLNVTHPDILDFISCKEKEGDIKNFNISVLVTDVFMNQLKENPDSEWLCSFNGEKYSPREVDHVETMFGSEERVTATKTTVKEIWDRICEFSHKNGEPGIAFIDKINEDNPLPGLGPIESSNPCVTEDTWVHTSHGPVQVKDVIGNKFTAMVNGGSYTSTLKGFFPTGKRKVYTLITTDGFQVEITENHKIKTNRGMVEACNIKSDDEIIINNHKQFNKWIGSSVRNEIEYAYLLGLFIGDGSFQGNGATVCLWNDPKGMFEKTRLLFKSMPTMASFSGEGIIVPERNERRYACKYFNEYVDNYGVVKGNKVITDEIEKESSEFYIEFLQGLFDADGTVNAVSAGGANTNVRLWQKNKNNLIRVQRMLLRLGMFSRIHERIRKGDIDGYELSVSANHVEKFADLIGFADKAKMLKLNHDLRNHSRYNKKFVTKLDSLKYKGKEYVYDCTIENIHKFDANGIVVSNCGEQFLHPYDNCNLLSININEFYDSNSVDGFVHEELEYTVTQAIKMLDSTIDLFDHNVEEVNEMARNNRRVGLGIMGWADFLFKAGVPYDSKHARELGYNIMKFISDYALRTSIKLARSRGIFPNMNKSIYGDSFILRNVARTSIAPTGSISMLFDVNSGIEPYFALAYKKKVRAGEFTYVPDELNKLLDQLFSISILDPCIKKNEIIESLSRGSTLKEAGEISGHTFNSDILKVFVSSMQIKPKDHVKMQAVFQENVDNSISKTINLPNEATVGDISDIFMFAYERDCKSVTVYRDGSRVNQVLNVGKDKDVVEEGIEELKNGNGFHDVIDRPRYVLGNTVLVKTAHGNMYITVNSWKYNNRVQPFEVFCHIGKEGADVYGYMSAITRMVSLALRGGVPIKDIADQLVGISCHTNWDEGNRYEGPVDALGKVLNSVVIPNLIEVDLEIDKERILKTLEPLKDLKFKNIIINSDGDESPMACPDCYQSTVIFSEACESCIECGWSRC